ncbi:MAG: DUF3500 domain-containing protein [Planctomycetaceae bacterium]|nr:DUF3500 domain-containing protein [Planctomycetaceae bacterium]
MGLRKLLLSFGVLGIFGALLVAQAPTPPASGKNMEAAAKAFKTALAPAQWKQCWFPFDDAERLNWHFIPRERKGLPLRDLEGPALAAAHGLIRSGLSEAGYDQTMNVMSLEEVLYLLEGGEREYRRERRHPGKYYLSIFGEPGSTGSWGWRVEGHHISLNFTLKDGKVVSSTPEFFGANPGLVDAGPKRNIRVLGKEEDIARQILKLSDADQSKVLWVSKTAPDEVPGPATPQAVVEKPVGLPVSKMSTQQKELLQSLLSEYLQNVPADVSEERRQRINAAGLDNIYFAWWGDPDLNQRHHYRVQGPTFVIEYNNTQNDANHVHSMWRDLAGDFAIPVK